METVQKRYYTQSEVDHLTPDEEAEWAAMVLIGKIEELPRHVKDPQQWITQPYGYVWSCRQNALAYTQTGNAESKYYKTYYKTAYGWEDRPNEI